MRILGGSYEMSIKDGSGHLPTDPIELMKLYLADGNDPQKLIREVRDAYGLSLKDASVCLDRALKDIFTKSLKLKSDGALKPVIIDFLSKEGLHGNAVEYAWKKILSARKIIVRKKPPLQKFAASA